MATTRDLDRLALRVTQRRHNLGATQAALARSVGLSKGTWISLENGRRIREVNYAKADKALMWATGSCVDVAEGGEPVVLHEEELAPGHQGATVPSDDREGIARNIVQSASIATTDGLSSREIRALSNRIVRDLKAHGIL